MVVGQSSNVILRKFKILVQHVSSYPKVTLIPLLFFACGAYGFHSVKKTSIPPPIQNVASQYEECKESEEITNPLQDFQSFKKWVKAGVRSLAEEIVASKDVKKQGLSYLERMFKNKQVHDSLITLLKGGVKDERFVSDSKRFGIDWISKTITAPKTREGLKGLMVETFARDSRVQ